MCRSMSLQALSPCKQRKIECKLAPISCYERIMAPFVQSPGKAFHGQTKQWLHFARIFNEGMVWFMGSMTVRPRRFGPGGFDPARPTRGSVVPGELDPGVFDPICFYYFTRNEYM